MTERLYWQDPYRTDARVTVTETSGNEVVFDTTPFVVPGGGQPDDHGTIGEAVLIATRQADDGKIVHTVTDASALRPGQVVDARVDWSRRYALMRHHSLLHVVHLAVQQQYPGAADLGSSIAEDKARIEYAIHEPVDTEALTANVAEFLDADLSVVMDLRDGVRTWSIDGHPAIPCGGTHVAALREIGLPVLRVKSAGRRGVRIYATATCR